MAAFPKLNSPIQPIPRQLVRCQSCIASVAMVISTPEERLRRQGSFGAVDHHFARPDGAANTARVVEKVGDGMPPEIRAAEYNFDNGPCHGGTPY
jgi:hypothetical protein